MVYFGYPPARTKPSAPGWTFYRSGQKLRIEEPFQVRIGVATGLLVVGSFRTFGARHLKGIAGPAIAQSRPSDPSRRRASLPPNLSCCSWHSSSAPRRTGAEADSPRSVRDPAIRDVCSTRSPTTALGRSLCNPSTASATASSGPCQLIVDRRDQLERLDILEAALRGQDAALSSPR
jgi:hypothetical protein